jgi:cytochrome c peroxidase
MRLPPFSALRRAGNRRTTRVIGIVAVCVAIVIGRSMYSGTHRADQTAEAPITEQEDQTEPIRPIEAPTDLNQDKVELGRALFQDTRLSHNNRVSCASCHDLKTGGADSRTFSIGIYGSMGVINAPTVFNSGLNFRQFWDGRAGTLQEQIGGPIQSKIEMGSSWSEVLEKLRNSPEYVRAFRHVYADRVRIDHAVDSIAEFERSLSTPDSRFDRYLRHDANALSRREKRGYALFKSLGCASCHQGMNVGGNMYQKVGVMAPYFADRGNLTAADRGRFNVTGDPRDMYMFKVPSLRNVELTAPYFHDGSASDLSDAILMMAKYQLGRHLADEDVETIAQFLKTLTGKRNGRLL